MKTKQSGYIEKKLNGKTIGIKFGTNAFALLCEKHGIELTEVDTVLNDVVGVRDLIFCAAKAASLSKGDEVWFNEYMIGDWLDDMTQKDYDDIISTIDNAKVLGNLVNAEEKKV